MGDKARSLSLSKRSNKLRDKDEDLRIMCATLYFNI